MTWRQMLWRMSLVGVGLALMAGCEPLYHAYGGVERRPTTLPTTLADDELWVSSVPVGADVYVQPFIPDRVPSHSTAPDMRKGVTPLQFTLPPGRYWIEVTHDADVFANYFEAPYDEAQFEKDGARSEALILQPFAPGEKRRVTRYYRLDKLPDQARTIVALFHPRGVALERVEALYPPESSFQMTPDALPQFLQEAQLPAETQALTLDLLRRGGKVVWPRDNEFAVSLEVAPEGIRGRVNERYQGRRPPRLLLPDGGGL